MATPLRELLALLDIRVDSHELGEADKKVEGFKEKLKNAAKYLAEAFAVREVGEFIKDQIELAARTQDTADRLGLSAQAIRAWSFAAESAGVDTETASRSLDFFERTIGEASLGLGEGAKLFRLLGVATKGANGQARPLWETLGDVADRLSKLPDQNQRAAYAMELFGREGRTLLPILTKGREGIQKLLEESRELGNGLGDDYYRKAKEAREESEKLGFAFQSIKDRIVSAVLPGLITFLGGLVNATKGILEFIKHTHVLTTAGVALGALLGVKLLRILWTLAKTFGLVKGSIVETVKALFTFAAPYAALFALYLLFDDLFTLFRGGRSEIGALIDELLGAGAAEAFVKTIKDQWADLMATIDQVTASLTGFDGAAGDGPGRSLLKTWFADMGRVVLAFASGLIGTTKLLVDFFDVASDAITPGRKADWGRLGKDIDKTGDAIFGKKGIFGDLGIGQTSNAIAGLPPEAVALYEQKQRERSTLKPGERYGRTFQTKNPLISSAPILPARDVTVSAAHVAGHHGGVHIHQDNHNKIDVHTSSDQPRAVGEAVGAGVATSTEKSLNNARIAALRP